MFKKYLLIFIYCHCLHTISTIAQLAPGEMLLGGQIGHKMRGSKGAISEPFLGIIPSLPSDVFINRPAWQGTFDYALNHNTTLGIAYTFQTSDEERNNTLYARIARIDAGLRVLHHYRSPQEFDLYSGLRVGYKIDRVYPETASNTSFATRTVNGDRWTLGLVLFGARFWIHPSVAITSELHLGRPYGLNIGVTTKL